MTRAYFPRQSTVNLVAALKALDGVERVHTIAPRAGGKGTGVRVYLTPRHPGDKVYTDFLTLSEARRWLAYEQAIPADFHCPCGWSRTVLPWESKAEVRAAHLSSDLHRAATR